jgi:hypothetical protein
MEKREVRPGEDWFGWTADYGMEQFAHLAEIGIPLTTDPNSATGTLLGLRMAECLSDEQLHAMLSAGVMMDTAALGVLWERGFGELTGVKPGRSFPNGVSERLTDHPLNGEYKGDTRWVSQAYFGAVAYEVVAISKEAEVLSELVRFDGVTEGACLTCHENELGGRVVVAGFLPWMRLTTFGKRAQTLAIADWISYGRLPLVIESPLRLLSAVRVSPNLSKTTIVLLNTGFDPIGQFDLRLRAHPQSMQLHTPDGAVMLPVRRSGDDTVIAIPSLQPWHAVVIIGM